MIYWLDYLSRFVIISNGLEIMPGASSILVKRQSQSPLSCPDSSWVHGGA